MWIFLRRNFLSWFWSLTCSLSFFTSSSSSFSCNETFRHFHRSYMTRVALSSRLRRSSVGSASACCKAGPSSILGSVWRFFPMSWRINGVTDKFSVLFESRQRTQWRLLLKIQEDGPRQMMKNERMYACIVRMNVKNKKMLKWVAKCPKTFLNVMYECDGMNVCIIKIYIKTSCFVFLQVTYGLH